MRIKTKEDKYTISSDRDNLDKLRKKNNGKKTKLGKFFDKNDKR